MATKKTTSTAKAGKGVDFKVSLEELLEAGAHFGHQVRRWNPRMAQYIWKARDGVHVFDLAKTAEKLAQACEYLYQAAKEGKRIVLVGTKRQAQEIIKGEALKAGIPFVSERWLGGLITNWEQIKKRLQRLSSLKEQKQKGQLARYTKKEQLLFDREIDRLERFFGGLSGLTERPEVLFVVDTHREKVAVREAVAKGVVVVGMTDTNANPALVNYPIPANDDAIKSIELVVGQAVKAISRGRQDVGKN